MNDSLTVEDRIRNILAENFVTEEDFRLFDAEDELGLDSLSVLKMVSFIEEEFRVSVEDEELIPENFSSIGSIRELIEKKIAP